jgi:hypothetical protein
MAKRNESPVVDPRRRIISDFRSQLRLGHRINGDRARAMATVGDLDSELIEKTIKEIVVARGSKGGSHTRDAYGAEYFSWLSQRRKTKLGWPKGRLRKNTPLVQAQQAIDKLDLNPVTKQMFSSMLSMCAKKGGK